MNICSYVQRKIRRAVFINRFGLHDIHNNMYVYRITFNLFRCKRKDRFTWHCRCPCYFNFFLQLFVEDIFSKKRPCQLEWPLLFVYMYVCVDLLSLCLYDEDDDESNSIEWRERSRERENKNMFCFFSLFDKYSMREIDETEIETWKRILLLSIVQLERVRLLHFNYHSIRFL
jgi:hypothetical protein